MILHKLNIFDRFKLPETKAIKDLDHPSATELHRQIIQNKPFLKRLYIDFYREFQKSAVKILKKDKLLVELGSGGGFIKEIIPEVVTTDVLPLKGIDLHFSALDMPFENEEVDAFFALNVLHHIPDLRLFFHEIDRTLKPNGRILMIEPANTLWSRFIYTRFHHEPFDPTAGWTLKDDSSPMTAANDAIPWIVFYRDRQLFQKEFPSLKILSLQPHTPFRYILSGGLTLRQLAPTALYPLAKGLENLLSRLNDYIGMFLTIELKKI
jgi:SAM-dependent methyltransferase